MTRVYILLWNQWGKNRLPKAGEKDAVLILSSVLNTNLRGCPWFFSENGGCSINPWGLPASLAHCPVVLHLVLSAVAKRVMEEFLEEASFQSNSLAGSVTTLTPGRNHSMRVWFWPASPQGMLWCQRAWWNVQENTVLCKVNFDMTWGIKERSTLGHTCCPSPSFTFLVTGIACGRGPELGALHYSPQNKYGRCMLKYLYFTEKTGLRKSLVCSKTHNLYVVELTSKPSFVCVQRLCT